MTDPAEETARKGVLAGLGTLGVIITGILAAVGLNEGGYVHHSSDPGGATNHGITEKVAREDGYTGHMKDFPKEWANDIIFKGYIKEPGFLPIIEISPAVGEEIVDSAVNFGPHRPSCWFQQSLNELGASPRLKVDCKIGPKSVAAFARFKNPRLCVLMLDKMDAKQTAEYQRLVRVNPKLKVFYRGWINKRVGNVDRKKCSAY
ncbi:glycoside hydrolase family 108 protein [Sphingopyxis flava]|uniref:Predicted Peptidoglycan domain-containing protein n=1 Tax=Sphingopyxis flava TaxID=1507287 RepID=A0A1T5CRK5_9SPHN|nr:glycosyl hydrolase 108 family protein [Sphingopyxis flava]SKB61986.1 Predicted Peptidoglycan domain-containing protein [Sphingopyxis flava]